MVINDIKIPALELAVNYGIQSNKVLGLGYVQGKSSDAPARILQALVDGGHIKSTAYSLWVDRSTNTEAEGTILFGGVNTAKYTGDLHTMPLPASNGIHYLPVVLVTKVSLQNGTSNSHSSGLPAYMALDSTISVTFLPNDIVEGLAQDLNVWWDDEYQLGNIDCAMKEKDYNITFTFIDFDISSPLSEFIGQSNGETCAFEIVPSFNETSVLGNNFLHNAYVVYDLANNEISMAPTNFDEGTGEILEIGSGATSVSGVFVSTTALATVPTAIVSPTAILVFPTKSTSSASIVTSTSKGVAATPTTYSSNILAGLVGLGLRSLCRVDH